MEKEKTEERLKVILTHEEMERIRLEEARRQVDVDVHGMTRTEAKRFLSNIVALIMDPFTLRVIHGYNNGHAIKDMVRTTPLSARESDVKGHYANPGITLLQFQRAF